MSDVIILVADENYLPHAWSLMVNCRREGSWKGDFAIVAPEVANVGDSEERGIYVTRTPETGFMAKFWIFAPFFEKWDRALYLDCDLLVQGDLSNLFGLLQENDPSIYLDMEQGSVIGSFWRDTEAHKHLDLYAEMVTAYPAAIQRTYNTSCMVFVPKAIPAGTPEHLCQLQKRFELLNLPSRGGTDQQIINLLLYERMRPIPNQMSCYWPLAGPQTVVAHYTRWYAPWLKKPPHAHAFANPALDLPCKELHDRNLEAFQEMFPCQT